MPKTLEGVGLPLELPAGSPCMGHGPCDFLSGQHCSSVSHVPLPFSLQAVASAAQASLLRQQEELDRKAAELERKERELQNTVANLHGKGGHTRSWVPVLVQESSLSLLVPGQPQLFAELLTILEWCGPGESSKWKSGDL